MARREWRDSINRPRLPLTTSDVLPLFPDEVSLSLYLSLSSVFLSLEASGALGEHDPLALHAGCPLRAQGGGESTGRAEPYKWIANHWIEVADDLAGDAQLTAYFDRKLSQSAARDGGDSKSAKKSGRRKRGGKRKGEL